MLSVFALSLPNLFQKAQTASPCPVQIVCQIRRTQWWELVANVSTRRVFFHGFSNSLMRQGGTGNVLNMYLYQQSS